MKMKVVVILCVFSLVIMAGCGEKPSQPTVVVENVEKAGLNEEDKPEEAGANGEELLDKETPDKEEGTKESADGESTSSEESNVPEGNVETLEGYVKSIGEASVVISKTFTTEEDGVLLMYGPAEGSDDEVLITVKFSENTKYELRTVKNSGVNGDSDVTESEASFSDLKEKTSITLSGCFTVPDKEYMADSVIIYHFV